MSSNFPPDSLRANFGGSGEFFSVPRTKKLCSGGFPGGINFCQYPQHRNWCSGSFRLLPWTVSTCSEGFNLEPPNKVCYLFWLPNFPLDPPKFARGSPGVGHSPVISPKYLKFFILIYISFISI